MSHLSEHELNDLVDDALPEAERARLVAHMASCAQCRAEADALRAVLAGLHALPLAIAPERDLLAGINEQIDQAQVLRPARWAERRTVWSLRYPLAAAAVLLILASSVITRELLDRGDRGTVSTAGSTPPATRLVSNDLAQLESGYVQAIADLRSLIDAQRVALAPGTQQLLEDNLRIIDTAIRESRAALLQDPRNEMVTQMLWSAYEMKLDLLRRATGGPTT